MSSTTATPDTDVMPYVTKAGDTFESLAYKFLGSGTKWYILADMNPHIFFPMDLSPGDRINVTSKVRAYLQ